MVEVQNGTDIVSTSQQRDSVLRILSYVALLTGAGSGYSTFQLDKQLEERTAERYTASQAERDNDVLKLQIEYNKESIKANRQDIKEAKEIASTKVLTNQFVNLVDRVRALERQVDRGE